MGRGSRSASHQVFKDKAKNRVDDLQGMFSDLQSARRESRGADAAVLEAQVHQMLREWKAELNEASPAASLLVSIVDPFDFAPNFVIRCMIELVLGAGELAGSVAIGDAAAAAAERGGGRCYQQVGCGGPEARAGGCCATRRRGSARE